MAGVVGEAMGLILLKSRGKRFINNLVQKIAFFSFFVRKIKTTEAISILPGDEL